MTRDLIIFQPTARINDDFNEAYVPLSTIVDSPELDKEISDQVSGLNVLLRSI